MILSPKHQSIVTGYSSYILEHTVEVLKTARCNDGATKALWLSAIRTLRSSFEHDRDGKTGLLKTIRKEARLTQPWNRILAISYAPHGNRVPPS
jgi:hypothetical protein